MIQLKHLTPQSFAGTLALLLAFTLPLDAGFSDPEVLDTLSAGVRALAVGDLDQDGFPEVLVARHLAGLSGIFAYPGAAQGPQPGAQLIYEPPFPVQQLVVSDLTQDGFPEILFALNNSLELLVNQGGVFPEVELLDTVPYPTGIAVEDFNRDGFPDIAVSDDTYLAVLLNDGTAQFVPSSLPVLSEYYSLAAADLTEDQWPDLLVTSAGFSLLFVNQGGTLVYDSVRSATLATGELGFNVRVADFNGDSHPDVLLQLGQRIAWVPNLGQGFFGEAIPIDEGFAGNVSPVPADLDLDGDPDVLLPEGQAGHLLAYENMGNGEFSGPILLGTGAIPSLRHAVYAPVDADSLPDLLWADPLTWRRHLPEAVVEESIPPPAASFRVSAIPHGIRVLVNSSGVLEIYSASGQRLLQRPLPAGSHRLVLPLPAGLYLVRFQGRRVLRAKVFVLP